MPPELWPAWYLWTTRPGHQEYLCRRCCAAWREGALDDPDLAPVRVEVLTPG